MQNSSPNEISVSKGIRERDPKAFNFLREKCFVGVSVMIKVNSGSEKVVEDVYTEGIERLIKTLDKRGKNFKGSVTHLFIKICRNIWIDELKREKKERIYLVTMDETIKEPADEPVDEDQIAAQMEKALFDDFIWQSFRKLKKDCQKIFKYFSDGKSLKDIGELMGLSAKYVKKRKYLCKETLVEMIRKHPEYSKYK